MLPRFALTEAGKTKTSLLSRIIKNPYRLLVFILCIINISLVVVNIILWGMAASQKLFFSSDFTAYYTGYSMIRYGEAANLYDLDVQFKYQQSFLHNQAFQEGVLPYISPPHVALIFSPISLLSLEPAFYLWSFIQLALLVWFIVTMNHLFLHWSKSERLVMHITILAFWPLVNTFLLGQFSILLAIATLNVYLSLKKAEYFQSGLWLSVLTIKPQALFIPAMLILNKRYWRVARAAILAGIAILVASIVLIGLRPWLQYFQVVKGLSTYFGDYGVYPTIEYTVRGVLANFLGSGQINLVNIISFVTLILGMLLTLYLWRKGVAQESPKFDLLFGFTLLLSAFLSLHLNPHDSLILVLPAVLFYNYLRVNNLSTKAFALLMLISPIIFFIAAFNSTNIMGVIRPPVVIILAMLVWMIKHYILDPLPANP